MSKLIDKASVKLGRLIRVWNTDRKKFCNSAKQYTAIWVEDKNGNNERCWLLTDNDIKRLDARSQKNKEDWTEQGFLTNLFS